jgi:hypothetical protein
LTYVKQQAVNVPTGQGHVMLVGQTKGINRNTGATDFMSDTPVINRRGC